MEQRAERAKYLEEFRNQYEEAFDGFLEFLTEFGDTPLPPDPSSMGFDERSLEELDRDELGTIRDILHTKLGIKVLDEDTLVRSYTTNAPEDATAPGEMKIDVLKTNIEGTFLQEIKYADNMVRWVIGPDQDI